MSVNASICIVSHNRKADLHFTLMMILERIDVDTEVIVGLDGCTDGSSSLKSEYPDVLWLEYPNRIGASAARRAVYELAKGEFIFGFDDDSHPVTADFVNKTIQLFHNDSRLGIVAFRIYNGMELPSPKHMSVDVGNSYACSEFAGCGFAISRKAYESSGGFPKWMNIYGEEAYVSLRAYEKGYRIIYDPSILVHHRIDKIARMSDGYRRFRFGCQLRNNLVFSMKLYPYPWNFKSSIKCFFHNLFKYGFISISWQMMFWKSLFAALMTSFNVSESKIPAIVIREWMSLPLPVFDWNPFKATNG
jgi:GT2 family glycosyltransferase